MAASAYFAASRRPLHLPYRVNLGHVARRAGNRILGAAIWGSFGAAGPEFDSDLCGEGRVGEISLSSPSEAAAGAGVCLRGFGLA